MNVKQCWIVLNVVRGSLAYHAIDAANNLKGLCHILEACYLNLRRKTNLESCNQSIDYVYTHLEEFLIDYAEELSENEHDAIKMCMECLAEN